MADEGENDTTAEPAVRRRSFWRRRVVYPLLLILALAFAAFWLQRETIADNAIGHYLRSRHIQATYKIERIGGARQVLTDIVVGDPKRPNLTIERAEVVVRYRLGFPGIARLVLTRPRLYGTYTGGKLSFGALDPILFTGRKQAFELPALTLELNDGRALLETDYGPVGIKADGRGYLRGGFAGELAASAPRLAGGGCTAAGTTLYGKLGIDAERPVFAGPLRLRSLACGDGSVRLARTDLALELRLDRDLAGGDGRLSGAARAPRFAAAAADAVRLSGKASLRDGELTADYEFGADGLKHPQAQLAGLAAKGSLRAGKGFSSVRLESDFEGHGFRPGAGLDDALARAAEGSRDTLAGALLRKLRGALLREARGSTLTGQASLRKTGQVVSLIVPQASLTGGSGERVLSLSRFQYGGGGGGLPRLSGNFATGGRDLPRIEGRIERRGSEDFSARLAMATYRADGGSIAIPGLAVVSRGAALGFSGRAIVSGDLPGGHAEGLLLPLSGNWSSAGGLALWRQCTKLMFDSLRYANVTLERHGLTVCPAKGVPIVRYGAGGLHIAAGVPSLDVAGRLGTTPIAIRSGPIGFAYPGTVSARELLVTLGPRGTATTFAVNDLTAKIGKTIAGRFGGTEVKLFAVPMNIVDAAGAWDYADGRLSIADGAFRLVDRQQKARFEPLVARGATLALKDNLIDARALLREPTTDAAVARVDIHHDLTSGRGRAELAVEGLTFGRALQPEKLTPLALGVVASVAGTVNGTGHIAWNENGVTSNGRFSSDSLDFAAAFGPVKGASGTLVFTDLIGLTTAPDQVFEVASINPGIEVNDGEISLEIRNGQVVTVNRGSWPFMGGTLTMRPVTLNLGTSERRAYVLEIVGLDAAKFIERMQLENISATGTFDGELPLIFDADGNGHLEDGLLLSRAPGGNVSYVGELTYEDLGTMANIAFDALRSLDYRQMRVGMNGDLAGEVITSVRIDGVSQGNGAKRNFLTRAIAGLPIRLDLNVRAQFYALLGNLRSLYDPAAVKDPRSPDVGLLDTQGNPIPRDEAGKPLLSAPAVPVPDDNLIQRRESEESR
jgi:hypothetical protein